MAVVATSGVVSLIQLPSLESKRGGRCDYPESGSVGHRPRLLNPNGQREPFASI